MNRQPVKSSRIISVGHDDNHTLEIEFNNKRIYRYSPVTRTAYLEMLKADSVGKYFQDNIKTNPDISYEILPIED